MAVVTGNVFTIQKKYDPTSLVSLNSHLVKIGLPQVKVLYSVTGGTANTVFAVQLTYSDQSLLISNAPVYREGIPKVKMVYPFATGGANTAEPTIFSVQALASFPIGRNESSSILSYRYAVTGLTPPPTQFWS